MQNAGAVSWTVSIVILSLNISYDGYQVSICQSCLLRSYTSYCKVRKRWNRSGENRPAVFLAKHKRIVHIKTTKIKAFIEDIFQLLYDDHPLLKMEILRK